MVEEGRFGDLLEVHLVDALLASDQISADSARQHQLRVGRCIGGEPVFHHVLEYHERVLQSARISRRQDEGFVRVAIGSLAVLLGLRAAAHVVEHRERAAIVLGLRARGDERSEDVLIGLHVTLLHPVEEALRLLHIPHLGAAGHERGVGVLSHHVVASTQLRVEVHCDLQFVVVLQMRRLRDPAEQSVGADGSRGQRAVHEVIEQLLQIGLGGGDWVARGHERGDGVLVGLDAVRGHVLPHAKCLQRERLARVVVDDHVEHVAVEVDAAQHHLLEERLGLRGKIHRQTGADEDRHGVAVGNSVLLDHRVVHLEGLVLVSGLLALLEKHVVHHHVGNQTTTSHLLHHHGGQTQRVAGLDNTSVLSDVQLVGKREQLQHLGLDILILPLIRNNRIQQTVLAATQVQRARAGRSLLLCRFLLKRRNKLGGIFNSTRESYTHSMPTKWKRMT